MGKGINFLEGGPGKVVDLTEKVWGIIRAFVPKSINVIILF